ncbi:MAG TPA: Tad domain-containing protein [Gemmatimonadota bacterium]|jgi:Flp pilus assembly protein TadG
MVLTAVGMVVFLGFAALAVDVGLLYQAQTQARRAADSGALAGAGWLLSAPTDHSGAKAEAELYTEKHGILNEPIDIDQAQDIEVEGDTLVRVFVRRTQARANPLAHYFARVLGLESADMTVKAAAIVTSGASVSECLWPFIPPDAWKESDGTRSNNAVFGDFDDSPTFGDNPADFYRAPPTLGLGFPAYTGWGALASDQGRYLVAKWGGHGDHWSPGWWFPMNTPPNTNAGGMNQLRDAIRGNCPTSYTLAQGDEAHVQTGFGGNAIHKALEDVLAWGPSTPAAALACYRTPSTCADSRRIRTMPLADPRDVIGPGGSNPAVVGNFAKIWAAGFCDSPPQSADPKCAALSSKDKKDTFVVMYLGPTTGIAANSPGSGSAGVQAVRLVE